MFDILVFDFVCFTVCGDNVCAIEGVGIHNCHCHLSLYIHCTLYRIILDGGNPEDFAGWERQTNVKIQLKSKLGWIGVD